MVAMRSGTPWIREGVIWHFVSPFLPTYGTALHQDLDQVMYYFAYSSLISRDDNLAHANSCLQTAEASSLTRRVVSWDPHLESVTTIAKVLSRENGALLANEKSSLHYVSILPSGRGGELTEKVLQPTLSGQMERSDTLRFLTP